MCLLLSLEVSVSHTSQNPSIGHFISFYFLPVPIPEPGLLTFSSRPRRSLGALVSLKHRSDEKAWVNQILQRSAFDPQSGWNGICVQLTQMLQLTQIHDKEGMDSSQNMHHKITGEHLSAQEEKPCCGACKLKEHP